MTMTFQTTEKADISHLHEELNIPKSVDIDYTCDLDIEFELTPDETRFGLNGIDITFRSVKGTIEWEAYGDDLTDEERAAVKSAGGRLMNDDNYIGQIELTITDTDAVWTFENEVEFTSIGSFYLDGVDVDFKKKTITFQGFAEE